MDIAQPARSALKDMLEQERINQAEAEEILAAKDRSEEMKRLADLELMTKLVEALSLLIKDGSFKMSNEPYYRWGIKEVTVKWGWRGIFGLGAIPGEKKLVYKHGERLGDFCPAIIRQRTAQYLDLFYDGLPPTEGDSAEYVSGMYYDGSPFWYEKPHQMLIHVENGVISFKVSNYPTWHLLDYWIRTNEENFGTEMVRLMKFVSEVDRINHNPHLLDKLRREYNKE